MLTKFTKLSRNFKYINNFKKFCTQNKPEQTTIKTEYPDMVKYFFDLNIKTKKLPCFEVYSSQIEIFNQPMDFYLAIIVNLKNFKQCNLTRNS